MNQLQVMETMPGFTPEEVVAMEVLPTKALPVPPPIQLICIVVTVYNQAFFALETLESVRRQSYPKWLCIIVDDGSTDDASGLLGASIGDDERFQYIRQKNAGPSKARNKGLELVPQDCDLVLWIDGDDALMPDALEILAPSIGDAPACAGTALTMDSKSRLTPRRWHIPKWLPHEINASHLQNWWPLLTPGTTLWRKWAIEKVGGWPDQLRDENGIDLRGEDVLLAFEVAHQCGPIRGVSTPTLLKREHSEGWCAENFNRMMQSLGAIQSEITRRMEK